jgi:hypothetical protein
MIANHDDNCHYDQQQVNFQSDEFTNESQDIQSDDDVDSSEIQLPAPTILHSALFLLNLKEIHKVSQTALNDITQEVTQLTQWGV